MELLRVIGAFCLYIAAQVAPSFFFTERSLWSPSLGALSGAVLLTLYTSKESLWKSFEVSWHLAKKAFGWALIGVLLTIALGSFVSSIAHFFIDYQSREQDAIYFLKLALKQPWLAGVTIFIMITAVPVAEEVLFRGLIQKKLEGAWGGRIGVKSAIVISSFLFALFHLSATQGWSNLEVFFPLFVFSCLLGRFYKKEANLAAPICLHGLFNACSIGAIIIGGNL